MKKYIVIGAGISGLATAQMLQGKGHEVVVYERDDRPGGLIKCDIVEGSLFHRTGGHVFNTKREDVMGWFWKHFDKEKEFTKAFRNSVVCVNDELTVPYPIENHVYCFNADIQKAVIEDWLKIAQMQAEPHNFEEFLKHQFGDTLYHLYFQPYNYKVWRQNLTNVPLSWLEGKLPMPTVEEMIYNNMNHVEERQFVHSSFFYPIQGGSQFLADRLSNNLNIKYNTPVLGIKKSNKKLIVNDEECDGIVYCGNLKMLPMMMQMDSFVHDIEMLKAHGTTSVFCEIDQNPYSWVYMPNRAHEAHRVICTGNFSRNNNADGKMTATVEFTDYISRDDIIDNLRRLPFHPRYITHNYEEYTYPIQDKHTRELVSALKHELSKDSIYLVGRFAEWEYCNMDVAIGAAMDLVNHL